MTKIVTHSGGFHTDDVFSVAALLMLNPDAELIRTRDPKVIEEGDIVVDVGGVYDDEKGRFDHHQEGGAGERENGIPYATFGLVWKAYGEKLCGSRDVANFIERKLVAPVDAFDNGVDLYTSKFRDTHPYRIEHIFFSLEPTWQEKESRTTDGGFMEGVAVAKQILEREIVHARAEVDALAIIEETYKNSKDKRLIVFGEEYMFDRKLLTDALVHHRDVLYIVRKHEGGLWQVAAAVDDPYSFDKRKPFPSAWGGKRDEELAEVTGVPDAVFCHNALFMCISKTQEGSIKLAQLALEEE